MLTCSATRRNPEATDSPIDQGRIYRLIYQKDRNDVNISQLGYGCMRFTRKAGSIDYKKAEKEVLRAIDGGVNYFDTAYIYPGSEECLGRILHENNCRDRVYIATKLPQYLIRSAKAIDKTFAEQLKRLRTDYIDYYLMHMFTDIMEWEKLRRIGIEEWIREHKENGSIKNIGFSYHGSTDQFIEILEAYDWDFCQIQYNYLDEHSQAGRKGLEAAGEKGIPVIIMEPLRGGKLVNIPPKGMELLKESGCGYSPAELALRWLWDQEAVTCVLSGMNSEVMIDENIRIASSASTGHLTEDEHALTYRNREIIRENEKVGCTACGYCMPCPYGVDIPGVFHYYNLSGLDGTRSARMEYLRNMGLQKDPAFPSRCTGCGRCETHCPQKIRIRQELKNADRLLCPPIYRAGLAIARKIMKR